ncbi:probable glutathione S-transferase [Eucalyptus grandis]|uniref:probable glutathione S-transferase n=1 Tax=Eucalyptus grandis TaxID=71139 RepID=UPI00192F0C52|nr:probable glutathione S-transferase [Eucalyptus grandis]
MSKLKIIVSTTSLLCTRIEWTLKLKGFEDGMIVEDWRKQKSELLSKSNPVHKKVLVPLDDGVAIAKSKVILEYIDEKWKGGDPFPLLPQDPFQFVSGISLLEEKIERKFFVGEKMGYLDPTSLGIMEEAEA